jgi:hypothetical protein
MTEADFKRYLVKSIRAQGGVGHRFEDKYVVGFPDLLMIPETGPVFFLEAKLVVGNKLHCTTMQGVHLERLTKEPHSYGAVIGVSLKRGMMYIGHPDKLIMECVACKRPERLDSVDWPITDLLEKYLADLREQFTI